MYRAAAQGKGAEKRRAAQALRGVSAPIWLQVCGLLLCFKRYTIEQFRDNLQKAWFLRQLPIFKMYILRLVSCVLPVVPARNYRVFWMIITERISPFNATFQKAWFAKEASFDRAASAGVFGWVCPCCWWLLWQHFLREVLVLRGAQLHTRGWRTVRMFLYPSFPVC